MSRHLSRQDLEAQLEALNRHLERQDPSPEARFRICLDTLLDGFAILTAIRRPSGEIEDFRYDYINESGCSLNQRSREETLGQRLLDLLPGPLSELLEAYRRVVETGEPLARETLFYEDIPDGGHVLRRAFDIRATRLGDGLAVAWRDTTERCRMESDLRQEEFRFRAIFENSSEAILLTAPDGRILAANPAACRIVGRSSAAICAGGRGALVEAADPRLRIFLETRLRTGRAQGELTLIRGDGTRFLAEAASTVFTDPGGTQLTVILFRDLTELRRLEADTRRLAALVGSTEDAIYAADMEGTITDWNAGAADLYGYTAAEAIGQPPSLIVPEELLPESQELIHSLREGRGFRNHETIRRRRDGSRIHVSITASPIILPDGTLSGISVIARDITERVEAAAERERMIQDLQTALAEVRTLSGLVPICSWCKRIRDDLGYWTQVEHYIQEHSSAQFTHGICPECATRFHPEAPLRGGDAQAEKPIT